MDILDIIAYREFTRNYNVSTNVELLELIIAYREFTRNYNCCADAFSIPFIIAYREFTRVSGGTPTVL